MAKAADVQKETAGVRTDLVLEFKGKIRQLYIKFPHQGKKRALNKKAC